MPKTTRPATEREQPLNVQIGKRGADDYYRRRDRGQSIAAFHANEPPRTTPGQSEANALGAWLTTHYPHGFPSEWFQQ